MGSVRVDLVWVHFLFLGVVSMKRSSWHRCVGFAVCVVVAGWVGGSATAESIYGVELEFEFDEFSKALAADLGESLPELTGVVVYDLDEALQDFETFEGDLQVFQPTSTASPGLGLLLFEIYVDGELALDEFDDLDFPDFPEVQIDNETAEVVNIEFLSDEFEIGRGIFLDESADVIEFAVGEEGGGIVLVGDPELLSTDPGPGPEAVPTPTAAAAGLALMGFLATRRRRVA